MDARDGLDVCGEQTDSLLDTSNARQVIFSTQRSGSMVLRRALLVCLLDRHISVRNILLRAGACAGYARVLRGLRIVGVGML